MSKNWDRALGVDDAVSLLPSQPRLVASAADHTGLDLLFYKHPPARVTHDGLRLHTLVLHTGGVSHVNDTSSGRRQQAWTKEGSFTLTPAFAPVERSWKGRPEVLLLFLEPLTLQTVAAELDADPAKLELVPRLAVYDATLHSIARLLLTELRHGGLGTALMLDCAARSIALHLLRRHSNIASATPQMRPTLGRRLDRAIEFMRERMEGPVRLADLAEASDLSPTHFGRTFKDATGKSPHTYLTDLRLERAQELLERSRLSIAEVADRCGFVQPQYFSTVFRQKFGITPSAWRAAKR